MTSSVDKKDQLSSHTIEITDAAIEKIVRMMAKENKMGYGLRLSLKIGGCAGFTYTLDFNQQPEDSDDVLQFGPLRVFVDKKALRMIQGLRVDYVDTLNESGFRYINPNAKSTCGCGTSFS